VTFRIEAEGEDLIFLWQKDGSNLYNDHRIHGTDTNTLNIQSVKKSDEGYYNCLVKNDLGSKSSHNAKLSVSKLCLYDTWYIHCPSTLCPATIGMQNGMVLSMR